MTTVAGLNWKGRLHQYVRALGAQMVAPLRHSGVSLKRPLFIWGNGQSGTFILYDLLAISGHFAFHSTGGVRKKGLATQRYKAHDVVLESKPIEGQVHCWRGAGLPFERPEGWVFDRILTQEEAARIDADLVRSRYLNLDEDWIWHAKPVRRLLDKSTNYLFMLAAVDRLFPDAQHIFMLRDPRLILSSILRRFKEADYEEGFGGFSSGFYGDIILPGWEAHCHEPIDLRHAWQVGECLYAGRAWAQRLGQRCRVIRHETLCANPVDTMSDLATWLEISYAPEQLQHAVTGVAPVGLKSWPKDASDPAVGRLFLDPDSFDGLTDLMRLAVDFGYDAETCGRPLSP